MGHGGRASRDVAGCGPGPSRASSRNGRSRWPATWSGAATASRAGTPAAALSWPPRRSRCTACRSSAARQVNYGDIDPAAARELFIQHALVEGDWQTHHPFLARNQQAREEAEELEHKARRRGLVADDSAVFDFYDARIPKTVTSARHFESWWKKARHADPGLLDLSAADLAGPAADEISPEDYPARWGAIPLSYEFAPGEADDGVTADIPLHDLFDRNELGLGWQVPGLRQELVTELIRGLPKDLRRHFIPAPDTARAVLATLGEPRGDLLDALSGALGRLGGVRIPRSAWDVSGLPAHLRVTYRVLGDDGEVLATGKDLDELRARAAAPAGGRADRGGRGPDPDRSDTLGLRHACRASSAVARCAVIPALADAGSSVDIRLFDTEADAAASMRRGTRRLLLLAVPSGVRSIAGRLPMTAKMAMSSHPYAGAQALLDDCAACAADQVIERRRRAGLGRCRVCPAGRGCARPACPADRARCWRRSPRSWPRRTRSSCGWPAPRQRSPRCRRPWTTCGPSSPA